MGIWDWGLTIAGMDLPIPNRHVARHYRLFLALIIPHQQRPVVAHAHRLALDHPRGRLDADPAAATLGQFHPFGQERGRIGLRELQRPLQFGQGPAKEWRAFQRPAQLRRARGRGQLGREGGLVDVEADAEHNEVRTAPASCLA